MFPAPSRPSTLRRYRRIYAMYKDLYAKGLRYEYIVDQIKDQWCLQPRTISEIICTMRHIEKEEQA